MVGQAAWNRKSNEQVVKAINEKFPEYDCSMTNYVHNQVPVQIGCPTHGVFSRTIARGYECLKCMRERVSGDQKTSSDEFSRKAEVVHSGKYDYTQVVYQTARIKVKIRCKLHDYVFEQTPQSHLDGRGCRLCANEAIRAGKQADKEHFVQRSVAQHGEGTFSYDNVVYKNAKTPVMVTCPVHGDFPTYPDNHWLGAGCPDCSEAGFSSNRAGILYVMYCAEDDITKVGITNSQLIKRNKAISKSYGKNFVVVDTYENDSGLLISQTETELILELRKKYRQPETKFDGYTECFYDVDILLLLEYLENKLGDGVGKGEEIKGPVWAKQREAEACTC